MIPGMGNRRSAISARISATRPETQSVMAYSAARLARDFFWVGAVLIVRACDYSRADFLWYDQVVLGLNEDRQSTGWFYVAPELCPALRSFFDCSGRSGWLLTPQR